MQQISLIPDHRMGFSQISVDLSQNRGDAVAVAASQPAAKFRLLHAFSHTLRRTAESSARRRMRASCGHAAGELSRGRRSISSRTRH
jgi:hypothetical protein